MDPLGPPSSQGTDFSPLFISLGIVATISLIIVVYHLLLVKVCISRRRLGSRSTSDDSFTTIDPMHGDLRIGVDDHVLKDIPVFFYSKQNIDDDQISECVICLGDLEEGDSVRLLPSCGHIFHVPCIDDWLAAHANCPVCRSSIVASPMVPSSPISHRLASYLDESPAFNNGTRERTTTTTQDLGHFLEQGDQENASSSTITTTADSRESLRKMLHSSSLILPKEGKRERFMKLKRSLSMDQCFVIIDIQGDNDDSEKASSSLSSSLPSYGILAGKRSCRERSMRQLDRISSRLLRSFPQIRFGQSAAMTSTSDTLQS
ncbi:RING-H2 finger protein ATL7-like [Mercurialis annua]|uniref:RING-H2 finger protein ATL7-like n=1 Tax=Mercurialis annua TaxID=3986 RepID=UPI00215E13CB|nr:RING-H2 finger protein ATL7-like [Mercurialis annua]